MKIFRRGVEVSEIAPASSRNENFLADAVGMLDDRDTAAAFAGFAGAEESGGAGAKDQNVEGTRQSGLTRKVGCMCQCRADELAGEGQRPG